MASQTYIKYHVDGSKSLHRRANKQGRREAVEKNTAQTFLLTLN